MAPLPNAVVVLATYRRPAMLAEALASLGKQKAEPGFALIVVDNDAASDGVQSLVQRLMRDHRLEGRCILEPRQGNVHAINRGFETALVEYPSAQFLLMMDDDEIASPEWVDRMIDAAERSQADIIGGPVIPRFQEGTPAGMQNHPVFWPAYSITGPVPIIYGTGNCLIRRSVFNTVGYPFLDPRFNFLGGGDTDFFTRCRLHGHRFYWAQDAVIHETVPRERTRITWIIARGLRIGAINRAVEKKNLSPSKARLFLKDAALLGLSLWRACLTLGARGGALAATHHGAIAVGRIASALGMEPQQYRASKTSEGPQGERR